MNRGKRRVITILDNLLSAKSVPEGTAITLDGFCQLYQFDTARSFIRTPGTMIFNILDEAKYGQPYKVYREESGIFMEQSYYQKLSNINDKLASRMVKEGFIYTDNFEEYRKDLESMGYIPVEGKRVSEACIYGVSGSDDAIGLMGYFVLERYEDREKLNEEELIEIRSLCKVANDKIENFETGKQLREEEAYKNIDEFTGLLLMPKFRAEVDDLIKDDRLYAMLYLDVDKFKYINDMWSYETGTEILQKIADVIKTFCGKDDRMCRVESDKFAMLLTYETEEELQWRIDTLDRMFTDMQQEQFSDIKITIICGIYMIHDRLSVNTIIDKANIARRSTKGSYKNVFEYYNQNLENLSDREKELELRMMTALENGEFVPFLQPKFDLESNTICGAEALARWVTDDRMISPAEFIPLFEKNGFITRLDFVMYEQVFQFIQKSVSQGMTVPKISMNVSRDHMDNTEFLTQVLELMDKYGVEKSMIELEITESVFVKDTNELQRFIDDARSAGLSVSIDDFGAAYSSLNLLKNVMVDVIKMDKSFIDNVSDCTTCGKTRKDKIIIKNIIRMINELEVGTIFEGIETKEHVEFLKEVGCKYGQGYVFARPMPLEEFERQYLR